MNRIYPHPGQCPWPTPPGLLSLTRLSQPRPQGARLFFSKNGGLDMRAALFIALFTGLGALLYLHSVRKEKRREACFGFDLSLAAERFQQSSGYSEADAGAIE